VGERGSRKRSSIEMKFKTAFSSTFKVMKYRRKEE
jgi:hypothetical protein